MSKQIFRILLVVALGMLLAAAGCKPKQQEGQTAATAGGAAGSAGGSTTLAGGSWTGDAQDFKIRYFDGKLEQVSANAGKPVIINFWAAW